MQNQMDGKQLVITTLSSIDDRIVATDFLHDWQAAIHSTDSRVTWHGQILTRLGRFICNSFTPAGTSVLLMAIFSIGFATLLFNNTEIQKEVALKPVQSQVVPVALDPNRPWYGPTDDLLQVVVLKYETQWPTYAIYDPLTMEIK